MIPERVKHLIIHDFISMNPLFLNKRRKNLIENYPILQNLALDGMPYEIKFWLIVNSLKFSQEIFGDNTDFRNLKKSILSKSLEDNRNYSFDGWLNSIVKEDDRYQKNNKHFLGKLLITDECAIEFNILQGISVTAGCKGMKLSDFYIETDKLSLIFVDEREVRDPIHCDLIFEQDFENLKISHIAYSEISGAIYYNIKYL